MSGQRFYEEAGATSLLRTAPAAARNREPIADVLANWLPETGRVLEIASGTGEHVIHFAARFPLLHWQPTDPHPDALDSIAAWLAQAGLDTVAAPLPLDASSRDWPVARADAILCINMVHISPWESALGLLDGAARLLGPGAPLILYGPWLADDIDPAPSNLAFDADLKRRNPRWGLRRVEDFAAEAAPRGLGLVDRVAMPSNNLMLLFRRLDPAAT